MSADNFPIVFMTICCGIIVVPFSLLVYVLISKGRKQAWVGTIIDKSQKEHEDYESGKTSMIYSVKIKSDTGRQFNLGVDEIKFNEYKVGDRLKKESGKIWPEKI